MKATLVLENGTVFQGKAFGAPQDVMFHLVCNNAMTGYQELLTDPAYAGQGIVMTYPLVGNYGVCEGDDESEKPWLSALVVRHLSPRGSNFRCSGTLDDFLKQYDIPGISGIDTRALTRILRSQGTMKAMLTFAESFSVQSIVQKLGTYEPGQPVQQVTTPEKRQIPGTGKRVALLDLGVANSVIRALSHRGCDIMVYPAGTPASEILQAGCDGVFLSGGPGSPLACGELVREIKALYESELPMFGMGLGHQLLALAAGMQVTALPYGHRGTSHPVREEATGRVVITAQNHGFTVVRESVDPALAAVSHVHVNDGTVEGLRYQRPKAFSVQFTPEAQAVSYGGENAYDAFLALL